MNESKRKDIMREVNNLSTLLLYYTENFHKILQLIKTNMGVLRTFINYVKDEKTENFLHNLEKNRKQYERAQTTKPSDKNFSNFIKENVIEKKRILHVCFFLKNAPTKRICFLKIN